MVHSLKWCNLFAFKQLRDESYMCKWNRKTKRTAQDRETIQDKEGANEEGSEARCIDRNETIIKHTILSKKKNHSKNSIRIRSYY